MRKLGSNRFRLVIQCLCGVLALGLLGAFNVSPGRSAAALVPLPEINFQQAPSVAVRMSS